MEGSGGPVKIDLASFKTRTFGKWILAGEHTVLRGGQALVFPLKSRFLDFEFRPDSKGSLEIQIPTGFPTEFKLLFWSVFEKACALKKLTRFDFRGVISMKSTLPVGSGLGASASLCVALTRWFQSLGLVKSEEAFSFAKILEDVFHGESSGVDVAVVLSEEGLLFHRETGSRVFQSVWQPEWYLSHCGESGITKECVLKVQSLGQSQPTRLESLDLQMKDAVEKCTLSLKEKNQSLLVEGLNQSAQCFEAWGLVSPALENHMGQLKAAGALAVKPTGSGLGGHVLSLWATPPQVSAVKFLKATV
jgi:mevalonate kinase